MVILMPEQALGCLCKTEYLSPMMMMGLLSAWGQAMAMALMMEWGSMTLVLWQRKQADTPL
jgi:hypothetical protein